ncbi:MAG: WecB/TagA/CpsF family glycosyltransferase [Candidatus Aureabacteria bacterium]|nr:WecB/TagA/CpsF family glycosyltransferase [Candidatus Auribacterota bacterium]
MFDRVNICGVGIDNVSMPKAIEAVEDCISNKKNCMVSFLNVDVLIKAQNEIFKIILTKSCLLLADGVPLLWAAKFLGTPLKEKISGSDLFPKLCEIAAEKGYKVFFLGGRAGAGLKTAEVLKNKHSKIQVAGVYSPPFGFEQDEVENKKIIRMIKEAKPDILFVGLGAPKQEKWIYKYKDEYQVPVSIGVGASFEFVSGFVKRAPVLMQKTGFEWFWRLMQEPKRLWKRYLVDDMKFFWLVLKQKYNKSNSSN